MKKRYSNKKQTLIIELKLKRKENEKDVFTASGLLYNSLSSLTDKTLIGGGQCLDCIPEFVETVENEKIKNELLQIYRLWTKYHLNDMHADCEHACNEKEASKQLTIYKYYLKNENTDDKTENEEHIEAFNDFFAKYGWSFETTLKPSLMPSYLTQFYEMVEEEKKNAGWVKYDETLSPDGILGKPCPECGYRYGSSWNYRPIPEKDKNMIKELIGE